MELVEKVGSNIDKTIKYVFKLHDNLIMETTYIDNNTGKDIICVSCQTMCAQGCKFCHLTDYIGVLPLRNLDKREITDSVDYIYSDLKLKNNNRTLLISYMGCGEPLANVGEVLTSMTLLDSDYENIRFGLATSLPKNRWTEVTYFTQYVKEMRLPVKVHLSLHYTTDEIRYEWMPNSLDIRPCLDLMNVYKNLTKNNVEIHYALINGVNDTIEDQIRLSGMLQNFDFNVKFMLYNEKESLEEKASNLDKYNEFTKLLNVAGVKHEYYEAPGKDVGASCGQFLFDKYDIKQIKK